MEQSNDLKDFWLQFYEALSHGDHIFVERHISHSNGVLAIGTDPSEWWTGHATIGKMLKADLEELVGVQIVAGDLQAYCTGTIGCVTDRPRFRLSDGTEIPMRLTSVVCKEENDWKIVLWHASFGVQNEQVFGTRCRWAKPAQPPAES